MSHGHQISPLCELAPYRIQCKLENPKCSLVPANYHGPKGLFPRTTNSTVTQTGKLSFNNLLSHANCGIKLFPLLAGTLKYKLHSNQLPELCNICFLAPAKARLQPHLKINLVWVWGHGRIGGQRSTNLGSCFWFSCVHHVDAGEQTQVVRLGRKKSCCTDPK